MIDDNEIAKYKKKTGSNVSKSKVKSKHKHMYKSCLITGSFGNTNLQHVSIASYCIICGKIGGNIDPTRDVVEHISGKHLRMLSKEEILEQNKDLEIFDIGDMWTKYVPLNKEEK